MRSVCAAALLIAGATGVPAQPFSFAQLPPPMVKENATVKLAPHT